MFNSFCDLGLFFSEAKKKAQVAKSERFYKDLTIFVTTTKENISNVFFWSLKYNSSNSINFDVLLSYLV
jgi:hypothetical protein